ncbi:1-deoxy-D-xylulose-5-phosphate synthase [Corynebacterium imitans]|uniref:1-deoxy-D-xylulose-5-phosphate synthase n=1 Tax=Corynebacterium imitans TaxID=156978 RepID=UPI00254EA46E|nr:1-deoxy-D-xylulose-5-phosphate synthase [Corynebacterium imitans]MDK8307124.1 1-deoxy-D-xylulose-5-phosphate synthase [Corynebacterium imitans]MDK8637756.1 1-deoxy-D-xylulose-5-phosphate synthase [Corynebacterium imitans]MDK8773459.1 1-deoxy-D-xylulose-5-phosphate synthase [Corynebacterium imitans]
MGMLEGLTSPADIKSLSKSELRALADEIRQLLISKVSATGGHLGPNLGVVELTLALHYVFNSPDDPIIFDTSHQSYVHKILTGRAGQFDTLRKKGGLSGYTARAESEHDWTESSHASASLSYADGLSKAKELSGRGSDKVVAVVGDGALTGGMCWEALNNIAAGERNVVIVVNDNGRSYSPTIGGFANNLTKLRDQLAALRMQPGYDEVMENGKKTLKSMGWVGERTFDALHALKEGVKYQVLPTEMFSDLGMKYVGPVEGHDLKALISALKYANSYEGPLIVHVVTEKGHGFAPAVNDVADQMHSTGVIDPVTGASLAKSAPGWTSVFTEELLRAGHERKDIVAITAAMAGPTGLQPFAEKFPDRFFDVGIAEQHAITSAAGLALGGMHPVVAVYSTFLNRAFDQLLMDAGLLHLPVTVVLDRAGVTGSDGASHNGIWDLSVASIVPGIWIAAPRDPQRLREEFAEAIAVTDGPTVVRFPKGKVGEDIPALERRGNVDVLRRPAETLDTDPNIDEARLNVLMVAVGTFAESACAIADELVTEGIDLTVVDPRWVIPVAAELVDMAAEADLVVVYEDGLLRGGVGSAVAEALHAAGVDAPLRQLAFPSVYPEHASRDEVLAEYGLDQESAASQVRQWALELADR